MKFGVNRVLSEQRNINVLAKLNMNTISEVF